MSADREASEAERGGNSLLYEANVVSGLKSAVPPTLLGKPWISGHLQGLERPPVQEKLVDVVGVYVNQPETGRRVQL